MSFALIHSFVPNATESERNFYSILANTLNELQFGLINIPNISGLAESRINKLNLTKVYKSVCITNRNHKWIQLMFFMFSRWCTHARIYFNDAGGAGIWSIVVNYFHSNEQNMDFVIHSIHSHQTNPSSKWCFWRCFKIFEYFVWLQFPSFHRNIPSCCGHCIHTIPYWVAACVSSTIRIDTSMAQEIERREWPWVIIGKYVSKRWKYERLFGFLGISKMIVHGNGEWPPTGNFIPAGSAVDIAVTPSIYSTSSKLRNFDPNHRQCIFGDVRNPKISRRK